MPTTSQNLPHIPTPLPKHPFFYGPPTRVFISQYNFYYNFQKSLKKTMKTTLNKFDYPTSNTATYKIYK
jgi:hypothetical protein